MLISEILIRARDLTASERVAASAFDAEGRPVHPLAATATSWDPVGAVQKTIGEVEGPTFDNALRCLAAGALKATPGEIKGIIEIHEEGPAHVGRAMWSFAIQAAERVERKVPAEVA